jgi:hypothetical protein
MDLGTGREIVSAEPEMMNDLAARRSTRRSCSQANGRTSGRICSASASAHHLVTRSFRCAATLESGTHAQREHTAAG